MRAPGALDVGGVSARAGGRQILDDVRLRLHPGEICALIGPSGAGKSTLIRVLLGLHPPSAGTVTLGGGALHAAGPVGYVPQDDALHGSLTVAQALDFSARLRLPGVPAAECAARIGRVCAQVGLDERLDVRIRKLSGGQRKRVSVAMELLTAPPVLILDEPTSGLDPGMEARMMGLFADLARSGRIVLVSTHAMQSLRRCDALAVLVAGHLVWFGPPADAPAFFRADHLAGVFDKIPLRTPQAWAKAWRSEPARAAFAGRPLPSLSDGGPAPSLPTQSLPTQSATIPVPLGAQPPTDPKQAARLIPGQHPGPQGTHAPPAHERSATAEPPPEDPRQRARAQLAALKAARDKDGPS